MSYPLLLSYGIIPLMTKYEVSADDREAAEAFLELAEVTPYADLSLTMYGETGTVREGLARCARHIMDRTPVEIRDMVLTGLRAQGHPDIPDPATLPPIVVEM
jgi:hypothetical protein